MGFGEAVATCFSKYAVFRGRASRPEYWYWVLFAVLLTIAAAIVDIVAFNYDAGVVSTLISLALLLPGLAVLVRRLHDIDRTGWWILIGFLPVIGTIVLLVFACTRGTTGPNRFG